MLIILILFINLFELYIILKKNDFDNNFFLINYLVNIIKILARDSSSDGRALA